MSWGNASAGPHRLVFQLHCIVVLFMYDSYIIKLIKLFIIFNCNV